MENKSLHIAELRKTSRYRCWLQYNKITDGNLQEEYKQLLSNIYSYTDSKVMDSALRELNKAAQSMLDVTPTAHSSLPKESAIILGRLQDLPLDDFGMSESLFNERGEDGYCIQTVTKDDQSFIVIAGKEDVGVLYGTFHLLRLFQQHQSINNLSISESPRNELRMINQWDNMDGSIERGYAGKSIFYENNDIVEDLTRIKDYARLLASVGINAISINNVNVWEVETYLITERFLPKVQKIADVFRDYGIQIFLSINYASPIEIGGLDTADPLDEDVQNWWKEKVKEIYEYIPDFGGFLVKADSEHRPGPFSYGRDHAEGANILAEALKPFNGIVIWRCFVYDCLQDWRDRTTDRARAAYDNFKPLDGDFLENVILQIKNGPMDFQVREPLSPLFGAMPKTNQMLELQVTQEYTGQQIDVCYLVPQWKEYLDFDTYAKGEGTPVKSIVDGSQFDYRHSGIAAVSNIGNDDNWTGHTLAQANLYGYGRLTWNPDLSTEEITEEWIQSTFGHTEEINEVIAHILLKSWRTYENYTAPLGVGWMVNPNHHYGPNVDGYEYDVWGTYHYANRNGLGVDRTIETGTGYTEQYFSPNKEIYNSLETCPDELLLFFHHVPYTHVLKSGETVIQHIYNTHFEGVEEVKEFIRLWRTLEGKIDSWIYENVFERFERQLDNAIEWRDRINTYFYRKAGIKDEKGRKIYP